MKPRVGVVVFPGSNDDRDALEALDALGADAAPVWHGDAQLPELDGIVLPGGFSYGDYLRAGALARFSPAMRAVGEFAATGGLVLGICNGFQVLCEAGLLPGALRPNTSLSFVCRDVTVIVERTDTPFTARCERGQELVIPVKHGEGCYVPPPGLEGHVVLRYAAGDNPNGSIDDIAGVTNQRGNVMGLMPHPEHAVDPLLGSADGALILGAFVSESEQARESRVLGERTA